MGRYSEGNPLASFDLQAAAPAAPAFGGGDPQRALKDPRFLQDLREHFRDQGEPVWGLTDKALIEKFYSDRNWADLNTVGAVADAVEARGMEGDQRERARRLQEVWQQLPSMFGEGGRGLGAVPDVATSLLLDPVNLVGGVAGKAGAAAATRTATAAGRTAEEAARAGLKAGVGRAAASEAAIGAVTEAGTDLATQSRDVSLGLQDEVSGTQALISGALGGAIGGVAGGILNIPAALEGIREGRFQVEDLRKIGIPDSEIAKLTNRDMRTLANPEARGQFRSDVQPVINAERAARDAFLNPQPATAEAETPTIVTANARLEAATDAARKRLDAAQADEADADTIEEAQDFVEALARLRSFGERLTREAEEINTLEQSNKIEDAEVAAERRAAFERDFADYRAALAGKDDEEIDVLLERVAKRRAAMSKPAEKAAAEPAAPAAEAAAPAETPATPEAAPAEAAAAPKPKRTRKAAAEAAAPETPEADAPATAAEAETQATAQTVAAEAKGAPTPAAATGTARKYATKNGIDLSTVQGTGEGGMILKSDVQKAREAAKTAAPATPAATPAPTSGGKPGRPSKNVTAKQKREALAKGVNWRAAVEARPELAPGEAVRVAMQEKFAAGQAVPDEYVARLHAKMDELMSQAGANGVETVEQARTFMKARIKGQDAKEFGDDLADYFEDWMERAEAKGLLYDDMDEGTLPPLSKSEGERAKVIARELRETEPDLEDQAIIWLAHTRALQERSNRANGPAWGEKSLTPSSGDRVAKAGLWEGAGRNPNGRIQSFLKRSTPIAKGSDYGIGGEVEYPMAFKFNMDEAIERAASKTGPDIVPFIARGGEPIKMQGQKKTQPAVKGQTYYADGRSRQAYDSPEYALYIRGDVSARGDAKAVLASTKPVPPKKDYSIAEEAAEVAEGRGDVEAFARKAKATAEGKVPVDAVPTEKGQMALIIRNRNTGVVRMMGKTQLARGDTMATLVGKRGNPDDWDVRYAPIEQRKSNNLEELWEQATETAPDGVELDARPKPMAAGEPFTPDGPPPRAWEDAEGVTVQPLTAEEARALTLATGRTVKEGDTPTYGDLMGMTLDMQSQQWGRRGVAQVIEGLNAAYGAMRRAVPEGHIGDVASRVDSRNQLGDILATAAPEERAEAGRLLDRLRGDHRPLFARSAEPDAQFDADPAINSIRVGAPKVAPRVHSLVRNIAHWAYQNVLTDADRLEFWQAMRKYEADNAAADLAARQMTVEGSLGRPLDLFADEFAVWWSRQDGKSTLQNETFWQKVVGYVKAIFDRYVRGVPVDPDLETLFSRLLTNDAEVVQRRVSDPRRAISEGGKKVEMRLHEAQMVRADIESAIQSGSHSGILNAHENLTRFLLRLNPKRDPNYVPNGPGDWSFPATRRLIALMNDRRKNYDEIMRGTGMGEAVGREDGLSAQIDGNRIVEAAETLAAFYEGGYKVWTPDDGVPAHVKNLDASSTKALLDMIGRDLENEYRKLEGGHASGIPMPESVKPTNPVKTAEGVKKARAKVERKARKTNKDAAELAKKIEADAQSSAEAPTLAAARDLTLNELRARIERKDGPVSVYAQVLRDKLDAAPLPAKPVPVSRDIVNMSKADINAAFFDAISKDDFARLDEVAFELTRRAQKRGGNPDAKMPVIKPKERRVLDAIALEREHGQGVPDQIGIPPTAPAAIRELLSYLTHRDPAVTHVMRTMTYRMLNLLNGSLDPASFIVRGAQDAAKDAGLARAVPAGVYDFRHPAFGHMRNELRRISVALAKGAVDPLDVAHEIGHVLVRAGALPVEDFDAVVGFYRRTEDGIKKMQARAYGDQVAGMSDDMAERHLAEEWFAEHLAKYLAERVTRGQVYDQMLNRDLEGVRLRNGLSRAFDRMTEYLAYVVNGLMGRNDLKQTLRRLTFYGDMLDSGKRQPLTLPKRAAVSPDLAVTYASDSLRRAPAARIEKVRAFVGNGYGAHSDGSPRPYFHGTPNGWAFDRAANPDMIVNPSARGNYGPGFYVSGDPNAADELYARLGTPDAIMRAAKSKRPDMSEEELVWLADDINALHDIRNQIAEKREEYAHSMMAADQADEVTRFLAIEDMAQFRADLDELVAIEEVLTDDLVGEWGLEFDPHVAPVYIRMLKPADFRRSTAAADQAPFIDALVARLEETGDLTAAEATRLRDAITSNDDMAQVYKRVTGAVAEGHGDTHMARTQVTEALKSMGHDGLLTTHINRMSVGEGATMADGRTYAAARTAYDAPIVFDPSQVKHVDASEFDQDSVYFWKREHEAVPSDLNAALVEIMVERRVPVSAVRPAAVSELVEKKDSTALGSALMSMLRGRKLNAREAGAMLDRSPVGWFKSQSAQMRHLGMEWVAGWYETHFPDVQQAFAARFWPLHRALAALPDAEGKIKGWARRATASIGQSQPDSHARIMRALRRPSGSRQEAALSAQEREVYGMIRDTMRGELKNLRSLGVMMGSRGDDYMPQVWSPRAIEKDVAGFDAAMVRYFEREAIANGRTPDAAEAQAFALRMRERLTGMDSDGVFIPLSGGSRTPNADNLDNARMIELDKYPEALEELDKFLEQDLEAVLTKYLEGSTRRATFIDKMGVNSHGLYDYLMVVDQGTRGIARLLSTDKVFAKEFSTLDWEGQPERMRLEQLVSMPFRDEGQAMEFAKTLAETHKTNGRGAAQKMLMDIAPKTRSGQPALPYTRRAEAILGALDDFKGEKSNLGNPEFNFIEDSMRVAMKKRRHGTTDQSHRLSAAARNFNSITLLGFTTLTSLGDLGLPIIRSGSMRNYVKTLKQFASDPEYRDLIAGTGVAIESIVHDRMLHLFGTPSGKLSAAFFNATLLTPWTDMNRHIAGAVGFESFTAMQKKAIKHHKAGLAPKDQPAAYRTAHRFLTRYGLADFLPDGPRAGETLSDKALLESDEIVRAAVVRFADDAIFTPNANDIPLWAQTPLGAVIFQLKSFPLMMQRAAAHILSEAKQGNLKPLIYLATIAPTMGMASLAVKDVIQQRGGEDGTSPDLRKRNILKTLGYDEEVHGDEDDFLGWYVEGLMTAGGFGLLADVAFGVAGQVEDGAYGQVRIAGLLGGPTVGVGAAGLNIAGGVQDAMTDGADNGIGKERAAAREVASRIPILGGIASVRDSIVGAVAGKEDDPDPWSEASSGYKWE